VNVEFFGKVINLHGLWDYGILERWNNDTNFATNHLQALIDAEPFIIEQYLSEMDVEKWADESFHIVKHTVYDFTDSSNNGSQNLAFSYQQGMPIGQTIIPKLGKAYYDKALPIIKQRLIAAAVRLAAIIETYL